jgi:hypothetical protein
MSSYRDHNHYSPSAARLNANRQNAQLSTGPTSSEGKAISSRNATKTALTGRDVLLPTDDAERYHAHVQAFLHELTPVGQRETLLAQSLADIAWRLERIASLEMAVYARHRGLYEGCYMEEPEAVRAQLIELDIYQANERQLRNFQTQEARLRRQRERDTSELRYLQAERRQLIEHRLELAAYAYRKARKEEKPFDPSARGFVFSTEEIEQFLERREAEKAIAEEICPPAKLGRANLRAR